MEEDKIVFTKNPDGTYKVEKFVDTKEGLICVFSEARVVLYDSIYYETLKDNNGYDGIEFGVIKK